MVFFGVVDTETTGLGIFNKPSPRHDDYAVSIGLTIADADFDMQHIDCIDCFYSLVRIPDPARSRETFHIHGISEDRIASAPSPQDVCASIRGLQERYGFEVTGAWNHRFDQYFVDRLFKQSAGEQPGWRWLEMQPVPYAKLDKHAAAVSHEEVRSLPAHNALTDSIRALGVFADNNGFDMDLSRIRHKLQA